jgi:hypothetical protein
VTQSLWRGWRKNPNDHRRESVNRDQENEQNREKEQPIVRKWLFRIVLVQPLRYEHHDIPNRNRINQDGERINLLSNGPEDGSGDCGDGDVKDLLFQETYER